jgi:hypothetical protein
MAGVWSQVIPGDDFSRFFSCEVNDESLTDERRQRNFVDFLAVREKMIGRIYVGAYK